MKFFASISIILTEIHKQPSPENVDGFLSEQKRTVAQKSSAK